jgi:hypothetical protein
MEASIAKALRLDPRDSRALFAYVVTVPMNDLAAVDRAYQRAIAGPLSSCGCEHTDYGNFLLAVGRGREARAMYNRAAEITPLRAYPARQLVYMNAAEGRLANLREGMTRVAALTLDDQLAAKLEVDTAPWTKDYDGGLAALPAMANDPTMAAPLTEGFRALRAGDAARRLAVAREVGVAAERCGCANALSVRMQAALGDDEGALASASELAERHPERILWSIAWDPMLDRARFLPSFAAVADRVGLVRYWRTMRVKPDFCARLRAAAVCRLI